MSLAIGHFAAGVTTACLWLLVTGWYRKRDAPFVLFAGGIWAMLPDVWRFIDFIPRSVHQSRSMNLFAGHYYMDVSLDPTDSHAFSAAVVGVMCLTILLVYGIRVSDTHREESQTRVSAPAPSED